MDNCSFFRFSWFSRFSSLLQLSKSSQAKNGGAYFSAVCGSNLVPVSATEGHEHRVCNRLLGFYPPGTFVLPHTCTHHPLIHGRFRQDLFRSRSNGFLSKQLDNCTSSWFFKRSGVFEQLLHCRLVPFLQGLQSALPQNLEGASHASACEGSDAVYEFPQQKNWTKSYHLITTSKSGSQICEQHSVEPSKIENNHTFVLWYNATFFLTRRWQRETC